jgi:tetratricopeptide (TPR) repeat protein
MNNLPRSAVAEAFETRIDILFRELELAIRWQRPSTLFAIYDSDAIRAQAEAALTTRISSVGHQIFHLRVLDHTDSASSGILPFPAIPEQTVYFVDGLQRAGQEAGSNAFSAINRSTDYFAENNLRIVFWLLESDAVDLTHYAPDCWALRHRVVEFLSAPDSQRGTESVLESGYQAGERAASRRAAMLQVWPSQMCEAPLDAMAQDPQDAAGWVRLGDIHFDGDLDDSALASYQKALSLAPHSASAWVGIGNVCARTNHLAQAIDAYREALVDEPDNGPAWAGLGEVLIKQNRAGAAITAFRRCVKLEPTSLRGWEHLGGLLYRSGKANQAIDAFKNAVLLNSKSGSVYRDLGSLFAARGDFPQARLLLEKSLDFLPDGSEKEAALERLRDIQDLSSRNRKPASAAEREALLVRLGPSNGDLGEICKPEYSVDSDHRSQHDPVAESILAASMLSILEPMDEEVHFPMGQHARVGSGLPEPDASQTELASVHELERAEGMSSGEITEPAHPDDSAMSEAAMWNESGHIHFAADRVDEAIAAYLRAIEISQGSNWSYINNLSQAHYRKGQLQIDDSQAIGASGPCEPSDAVSTVSPVEGQTVVTPSQQADNRPWVTSNGQVGALRGPGWPLDGRTPGGLEVYSTRPQARGQHDEINFRERTAPPARPKAKYPTTFAGTAVDDRLILDALREDQRYGLSREQRYRAEDQEILAPQRKPASGRSSEVHLAAEVPAEKAKTSLHLDKEPGTANGWLERGNEFLKSGRYDEAIACYNRSLLLAPGAGGTFSNMALAYCYKEQYAEAIPLYQKSIFLLRTNKERAISWNRLGDAYRRLNDQTNAAAAYRNAANLNPGANTLRTRARNALLSNAVGAVG